MKNSICICSRCGDIVEAKVVKFEKVGKKLNPCCLRCAPTFQEMLERNKRREENKMTEEVKKLSVKDSLDSNAVRLLEVLDTYELNDMHKRRVCSYVYHKITKRMSK